MSKRKKTAEAPENHERWLITYADLITLLMIFFVVMYSMSKVEMEKFNKVAVSLTDAFYHNSLIEGTGRDGFTGNGDGEQQNLRNVIYSRLQEDDTKTKDEELKLQALRRKLETYIKANHLEDNIELKDISRGVQISMKDKILFGLGKADLTAEAKNILSQVGDMLKELDNPLSIEGHTDDRPIVSGSIYRSNFELSATRSASVLHHLIQQGIKAERLHIVGYGEYKPLYENDTEEHRQANRRVDIVVLR